MTYALSNAPPEVPLTEVVGVRSERHRVERVFQEAKGEVGPGALRGPELGGLASPCQLSLAGVVVPDPGATADRGGKPRR